MTMVACGSGDTESAMQEETPHEENLNESDIYTDVDFFDTYANETLQLMAMSAIASEKAQNSRVRAFADSLQQAHGKVFEEMKALAKDYNFTVSEQMLEPYAREVADFQAIAPSAIDEKYLQAVIGYHESIDEQARNMIEESEIEAFLDFARRLSSNQYVHRRTARDMLNDLEA